MEQNPYASPTTVSDPNVVRAAGSQYAFRLSPMLVPALLGLLWINLAVDASAGVLTAIDLAMFKGRAVDLLDQMPYQQLGQWPIILAMGYGLCAMTSFFVYLATVVCFAIWLHRANCNARALGAEGMTFTPNWTVGAFFVPIANLIRPFQGVAEIAKASHPSADSIHWKTGFTPAIIGWWWAAWITVNVLSQVVFRMELQEGMGTSWSEMAALLGIVLSVLQVVLCLLAMQVVRTIHRWQIEKHATSEGRSNT